MVNQKPGNGPKRLRSNKYLPWILGSVRKIQDRLQQHRAKKKKENSIDRAAKSTARATWAIAFLTVVTIGVGVSQYFIFGGQLNVMQRQLTAMEADQRPWISTVLEPASDLTFDDSRGIMLFKYTFHNVGRSPAFNLFPMPMIVPSALTVLPNSTQFIMPVDVTAVLKNHCAKLERDMKNFTSRDDIFPAWGEIIYPGETISKETVVYVGIPKRPPASIYSYGDSGGPLYLISCIDYQSSTDWSHHQIGEAYILTQSGHDVDGRNRSNVPQSELGLRAAQIWGSKYAN